MIRYATTYRIIGLDFSSEDLLPWLTLSLLIVFSVVTYSGGMFFS